MKLSWAVLHCNQQLKSPEFGSVLCNAYVNVILSLLIIKIYQGKMVTGAFLALLFYIGVNLHCYTVHWIIIYIFISIYICCVHECTVFYSSLNIGQIRDLIRPVAKPARKFGHAM